MDSMRSLNTSLPTSATVPPDQLLQAFKQAALSVTNLYKSAAGSQEASRQAGYQDALVDLLKFLDRQNIGLQDGEGWKVREWLTARYDGGISHQQSDSEDESVPAEQRLRSSSPVQEATEETHDLSRENNREDASSRASEPPVFRFTAGDSTSDHTMQIEEAKSQEEPTASSSSTSIISTPVRLDAKNRGGRNPGRGRPSARAIQRNISGTKRRMPFPDFSEIFNVGFDKKDGFDGSGPAGSSNKRNRFT